MFSTLFEVFRSARGFTSDTRQKHRRVLPVSSGRRFRVTAGPRGGLNTRSYHRYSTFSEAAVHWAPRCLVLRLKSGFIVAPVYQLVTVIRGV